MAHAITPQTGGSPDPADVIGRDDLILKIVADCRRGNNHLLNDPRRMGKTSLLIRLCNAPGPRVIAVKVDLESASTVDEVVFRILRAVTCHSRLTHRIKDIASRYLETVAAAVGPVKLGAVARTTGAQQALKSCLEAIEAKLDDDEILIIALDEITIAAHNLARRDSNQCDQLLQTLRHLRNDEHRRVRWILSGSIGFHHVLRHANLTEGLINDVATVELGPLEAEYAKELLTALLAGIGREPEPEVIDHLIRRTDGIPFILHHVAHRLAGRSGKVSVNEAEEALSTWLRDRGKSSATTHLVSRVSTYYGKEAELAESILDHQARYDTPITLDEILAQQPDADPVTVRWVVDALVDDHYLDNSTLQWRYPLLRETWIIRRHILSERT